jgi:hypothetical protein
VISRMRNRRRPGRSRILAALGVTSLALIAASPANAIYRDYEAPSDQPPVIERTIDNTNQTPVDENGKKSCEYAKFGGGTGYYPHGTKITVTLPNGASKTVTCNDGNWEESLRRPDGYRFRADLAYVDASGALVLENAYQYSTSGQYYAQQ